MRIEDYPPQEPFSEVGKKYVDETLSRSEGCEGIETNYGSDPHQGILLFPSKNPDGRVLIFIYGGGWTNGYKESMAFYSRAFEDTGITFLSIGYRLAPKTTFPEGWLDCARAVAWTYKNISRYGGDPSKIYVSGHSAGGHYSSLMAVRRDWQAPLELPEDVVCGALPISGTYEFGANSGFAMRPRFLGDPKLQNETSASPINYLHLTPPPMLLTHGDNDFPHLIKQQNRFSAALKDAGGDVEELVVADSDHFSVCYACGMPGSAWSVTADKWIKKQEKLKDTK